MRRSCCTLIALLALCAASPARAQHEHHAGTPVDPRLEAEIDAVRDATLRYRDHARAVEDGYVRFGGEGALMGEHWYRRDLVGRPLDLARPSTLQYVTIDGERTLAGVAYTVYRHPAEPMPDGFSGDLDEWHVHDTARIRGALLDGRPVLRWLAERSVRRRGIERGGRTHLTMVHAWVWIDNPEGVFAQEHRALPWLRAGRPAEWARGADRPTAMGVALLSPATCDAELKRLHVLARPSREQRIVLSEACARAERDVRTAPRWDREALNAAAAVAWRAFERTRDATLTPEQQAKLTILVEHTPHGAH